MVGMLLGITRMSHESVHDLLRRVLDSFLLLACYLTVHILQKRLVLAT
jgi:hypothetical protein